MPASSPNPILTNTRRSGFTLLEMILALLIGVVVLGSFYSVLSYQVRSAQSGRLMTREATLARSIMDKISKDILYALAVDDPLYLPSPTSTTPNMSFNFNNGVYGQPNCLVMCVTKVPGRYDASGGIGTLDPTIQATACDLRRISYWLEPDGLAYQIVNQATSDDTATSPPSLSDNGSLILAPEVKDVSFQYFDGLSWQDTWDGTTLGGPNETLPIGPPSAIRVTLTFYRKDLENKDVPDDLLPKYTQEVALPAGNNFPQTNQ